MIQIDLTLEQINADSACQRTGIIALTNSISARQRWSLSHTVRTLMISHVLERVGLTKKEDVSQEVKPNIVRKNCEAVSTMMDLIDETTNPVFFQY